MAKKTALTLAAGVALASAMTAANAAENPFVMKNLEKGYMLADAGEKAKEAKPVDKNKSKEAKKEEMKPTDNKMPEGKCGEGKCGGAKK